MHFFIWFQTGIDIWKMLTFPCRTSRYTSGFKASNLLCPGLAHSRGLTPQRWHMIASIGPSFPEQSMVLSTETCFHWASAWFWKEGWLSCGLTSFMQIPSWFPRQGPQCQPFIPTVWMPLTCTVCKHNQVESESLQVLTFLSSLLKSTLEGFIYWLSAVILIHFLPLVNFFLQNTPSWDWESFSDSGWILMW